MLTKLSEIFFFFERKKKKMGVEEREPQIVASFTNWHSLINNISWLSGILSKKAFLCKRRFKPYII